MPRNALYRNLGNFRFEDVTDRAGVGDTGHGVGVTAGDFDNDGNVDLFVSNFGPKVLYRNNGDGTFTDVTAQAAVADGNKVARASVSSTWRETVTSICTSPTTLIFPTRRTNRISLTAATSIRRP